jgi:hypothetical protein
MGLIPGIDFAFNVAQNRYLLAQGVRQPGQVTRRRPQHIGSARQPLAQFLGPRSKAVGDGARPDACSQAPHQVRAVPLDYVGTTPKELAEMVEVSGIERQRPLCV